MSPRQPGLIIAVASLLLARSNAPAAEHPLVELAIDECVVVPEAEVRRVVAIELGALLTGESGPSEGTPPLALAFGARKGDRTRVDVGCTAQGSLVELRVDDPITGKRLTRTIDLLRAAASARPRLLALGIAELVSASWTELQSNPHPAVPPAAPPPSPAARQAALASVNQRSAAELGRLRVALAGAVNVSLRGPLVLAGGLLRVGRLEAHHLAWSLDVAVLRGETPVPLGKATIDQLSLGSSLGYHHQWARLALRLGAGVRGGAVQLAGRPLDASAQTGSSFWAPWMGVVTHLAFGVALARRLLLELEVEAGYTVLPVGGLVDGQRAVGLEGPWIGATIALGLFL